MVRIIKLLTVKNGKNLERCISIDMSDENIMKIQDKIINHMGQFADRLSLRNLENKGVGGWGGGVAGPVSAMGSHANGVAVVQCCRWSWRHDVDKLKHLWIAWWRYQMESFSALLSICERNPLVTCGFSSQRPVTRSCDIFSDVRPKVEQAIQM